MKVAVVLLSLMIFFLNAIPCCWDTCTENDAMAHAGESTNSSDTCSPFLSGSGTGFILEQEVSEISLSEISSFQILNKRENPLLSSDFSGKIWAPPKGI